MSDFEDVLKTHYAANPHVASQVAEISRRATEAGAAKQTGLPASEIGSDDAILQAHYAASPHVAAQVASNTRHKPPPAVDTLPDSG